MFYLLLAKSQRLQGKEVRFLTRKKQVFRQGIFVIFFTQQYANRNYHQLSFHIPLALSKRAVQRHKIKRILIKAYEQHMKEKKMRWHYFKCFITLHKMKLEELASLLQKKQYSQLEKYLIQKRTSAFTSFLEQYASRAPNSFWDNKKK